MPRAPGLAGLLAALAAAAAAGCSPRADAPTEGPVATRSVALYWTTARAVDRLDLAHMGRSLREAHASDEARAIAVWQYVRRTMYHYPMRNENHADRFDAAKLVNVYGYSFCTQQGVAAAAIARAAGLKSRVIGVPGHGMYEVHYDGGWHAFCTTAGFFVRTREEGCPIASMDELKTDPSLALEARREGRASEGFLPCAGGPDVLGEKEGTEACPYALTYRHYDEKFFAEAAKKWKDLGAPNPSQHAAWVPLRRGESLRLDWAASGSFVPPRIDERFWPPRHLCGARDRANPFFEGIAPYARRFRGRTSWRYYGSGEQVWRPALARPGALEELARAENVRLSRGALAPADPSKPAVAEFEMAGPYVHVDGAVEGTARVGEGGSLRLLFQGTDPDAPWEELHVAPAGRRRFRIELGPRVQPVQPKDKKKARACTRYRFRVRAELSGEAAISDLVIRAAVQHNWCALPRLAPGRNEIEVRARDGAPPPGAIFELAWEEEGRERALRRRVRGKHERFAAHVKGDAAPRMLRIVLSRE